MYVSPVVESFFEWHKRHIREGFSFKARACLEMCSSVPFYFDTRSMQEVVRTLFLRVEHLNPLSTTSCQVIRIRAEERRQEWEILLWEFQRIENCCFCYRSTFLRYPHLLSNSLANITKEWLSIKFSWVLELSEYFFALSRWLSLFSHFSLIIIN